MRKVIIAYGALILVVVILAVVRTKGFGLLPQIGLSSSATAEINGQIFNLSVVKNDEARMKGLSNRKSLDENKGMLFIFDEKGKYKFWMKDVEFPLDIIYISDDKIVDIIKNAPPQSGIEDNVELIIYEPKSESNFVLEINGGLSEKYEFKDGDIVIFEDIN